MIYNNLRYKQNRKYIIVYILPILLTIFAFIGIYVKYQKQEFGNLSFEYKYRVNMKNVNIQNKIEFSNEEKEEDIFYAKKLNKEETKELAESIFKKVGTNIDEKETIIYEDTVLYYSNNRKYSIWIYYAGGVYAYTDFGEHSSKEDMYVRRKDNADREEIEKALRKLEIIIPESAEFKKEKKGEQVSYVFTVNMERQGSNLIDGKLTCTYYEDGTVKGIRNNIIKYEKISKKKIISEEEAYKKILDGKFGYDDYYLGKIKDFIVESVKLGYFLDTKGYYVPIYVFDVKINDRNTQIYINTLK